VLETAPPLVYLAVLLVCWGDAFLPVLPSETTVVAAGALTVHGDLDLVPLIGSAALGALSGDLTSATLGRVLPRRDHRAARPRGRVRQLARAIGAGLQSRVQHNLYLVLLLARFIPGGRTAVTVGLGRSALPMARLLAPLAVAGTLWALITSLAGRVGATLVFEHPAVVGAIAAGVLAIAVAAAALWNRRNPKRNRADAAPIPADSRIGRQTPLPDCRSSNPAGAGWGDRMALLPPWLASAEQLSPQLPLSPRPNAGHTNNDQGEFTCPEPIW
jgi:membrane protein DedA with SNARE-associated domain